MCRRTRSTPAADVTIGAQHASRRPPPPQRRVPGWIGDWGVNTLSTSPFLTPAPSSLPPFSSTHGQSGSQNTLASRARADPFCWLGHHGPLPPYHRPRFASRSPTPFPIFVHPQLLIHPPPSPALGVYDIHNFTCMTTNRRIIALDPGVRQVFQGAELIPRDDVLQMARANSDAAAGAAADGGEQEDEAGGDGAGVRDGALASPPAPAAGSGGRVAASFPDSDSSSGLATAAAAAKAEQAWPTVEERVRALKAAAEDEDSPDGKVAAAEQAMAEILHAKQLLKLRKDITTTIKRTQRKIRQYEQLASLGDGRGRVSPAIAGRGSAIVRRAWRLVSKLHSLERRGRKLNADEAVLKDALAAVRNMKQALRGGQPEPAEQREGEAKRKKRADFTEKFFEDTRGKDGITITISNGAWQNACLRNTHERRGAARKTDKKRLLAECWGQGIIADGVYRRGGQCRAG